MVEVHLRVHTIITRVITGKLPIILYGITLIVLLYEITLDVLLYEITLDVLLCNFVIKIMTIAHVRIFISKLQTTG